MIVATFDFCLFLFLFFLPVSLVLSIVHNDTTKTTTTPNEAAQEYKTALKHIAELYTFLSPILPTVEEAERTIKIYRREGQAEMNNKELGGHPPEEE